MVPNQYTRNLYLQADDKRCKFPLILPGMANQGFDAGEAIAGQGMSSIQRIGSGIQGCNSIDI